MHSMVQRVWNKNGFHVSGCENERPHLLFVRNFLSRYPRLTTILISIKIGGEASYLILPKSLLSSTSQYVMFSAKYKGKMALRQPCRSLYSEKNGGRMYISPQVTYRKA